MFAGYRDVQLAGEGGLGRVYRAVRESTGGVVAIKELRDVPSASPAWHRARRELDAMLRLKGHPYVVSVEEIFDGPEGPCIVMEYLDGGTLMDRMRHGPMAVPELLLVGEQVSQALGAAHEAGIVHRDVKPHNLLVGSFGQVKVADFGIAALTREAGLRTQTQAFTLAYASPEELDGEVEVGAAADVYSFAATMFHLATGRKPSFRDRTNMGDFDEVSLRHPVMVPVVAALRKSLEIDPGRRPTMRELHRVFGNAALQLGEWRISRLDAPGSVVDPPIPPPTVAPVSVAHAVSVDPAPTYVYLPATDTVIRPSQPVAPPSPVAPAPIVVIPPPRRAGGARRWFATGAAIALLCSAAVIATLAFTGGSDARSAADDAFPADLAAAATTLPEVPTTVVATVTSTTVAITLPATVAPTLATLPVVTVPAPTQPPATLPPATVPPVTAPPATAPPLVTTPPLLSESAATTALARYLDTAIAGSYPEAFAMATPKYQEKYGGYDLFVTFWKTVNAAGVRSCSSIYSNEIGQTLHCYLWFRRVRDGGISNEIVDVDVVIDRATSIVRIDDYRNLAPG